MPDVDKRQGAVYWCYIRLADRAQQVCSVIVYETSAMILLDSDVMIDLLRQYPPAMKWFDTLEDDKEIILPGYVMMELIQGCRNKIEQEKLQREIAIYGVVWPSPADCDKALEIFTLYRLSHSAGLLDVLIGQTAVALNIPLYTFNHKHYQFVPGLQTIQPYEKGLE